MDPLTALTGGAAAVLLKRLLDMPGEIRRNDERVRNRDEDLARWISDDDRFIERECHDKLQVANAAGVASGGFPAQSRRKITAHALHRYRDQVVDAERVVRDVRISERTIHRVLRKLWRRPVPTLGAPERQRAVLEKWTATQQSPPAIREAA